MKVLRAPTPEPGTYVLNNPHMFICICICAKIINFRLNVRRFRKMDCVILQKHESAQYIKDTQTKKEG